MIKFYNHDKKTISHGYYQRMKMKNIVMVQKQSDWQQYYAKQPNIVNLWRLMPLLRPMRKQEGIPKRSPLLKKAHKMAVMQGPKSLVQGLKQRLKIYQTKRPYHQTHYEKRAG